MASHPESGQTDHTYHRPGIQIDQSDRSLECSPNPETLRVPQKTNLINGTPSGEVVFKLPTRELDKEGEVNFRSRKNGPAGEVDALIDRVRWLEARLRESEEARLSAPPGGATASVSPADEDIERVLARPEKEPTSPLRQQVGLSPPPQSELRGPVPQVGRSPFVPEFYGARQFGTPPVPEGPPFHRGYPEGRRNQFRFDHEINPPWRREEQKIYRKPDTYDGKRSWNEYLVHFELVAGRNGWSRRERAVELAINLRGAAQSVLSDLSAYQRQDYDELVKVLQSTFEPENQGELYKAELKHRIRNRGETLADLSKDIKKLVRKAYPDTPREVREHLATDYYRAALNDYDLEWAVHQGKPKNVEEAQSLALEYEAFERGRRQRTLPRSSVRRQQEVFTKKGHKGGRREEQNSEDSKEAYVMELREKIRKLEDENKRLVQAGESRPVSRKKLVTCYYCNEEGHIKPECEKWKQERGDKEPRYITGGSGGTPGHKNKGN